MPSNAYKKVKHPHKAKRCGAGVETKELLYLNPWALQGGFRPQNCAERRPMYFQN